MIKDKEPGTGFLNWGGGGAYNNGCLLSLRRQINSPQNKTWEVVKNSASPKRPFFFGVLVPFPPFWEELPMNTIISTVEKKGTYYTHAYLFSLGPHPNLIQSSVV